MLAKSIPCYYRETTLFVLLYGFQVRELIDVIGDCVFCVHHQVTYFCVRGSVETVRACGGYKGTSGYSIDWNAWTESRMDNFTE